MEFVPLIALSTLVIKFMGFLKALTNRDWNTAVTQLVAWGAGVGAIFIFGATQFDFPVGDVALSQLGAMDKLVVGLTIASVGGFLYDTKKAIDDKDTAKEPHLLPGVPDA